MEGSRPEYWSGLPFSSPKGLLDSGVKPRTPELQILYHLSHQMEVSTKAGIEVSTKSHSAYFAKKLYWGWDIPAGYYSVLKKKWSLPDRIRGKHSGNGQRCGEEMEGGKLVEKVTSVVGFWGRRTGQNWDLRIPLETDWDGPWMLEQLGE